MRRSWRHLGVRLGGQLGGAVPTPIADTQVMAMVLGFGEAASYETLASKLAGARIDKTQRFTVTIVFLLYFRTSSFSLFVFDR